MKIAVDWDHTLYDEATGWLPDAKRALKVMKRKGHKVVIHSCRASYPAGEQFIRAALRTAGYPDIQVTSEKLEADVYIDDKALRYEGDWSTTLSQLSR